MKYLVAKAKEKRKAGLATPAERDPWGDKLALKLAWVDQYNDQVTSLLHDQHGKEAHKADDPKLQFMLANTQTLACAVEKVASYVVKPRTKAHNEKAYDEAMAKVETAFDRIVEQVNLALQINGQANVQKLVEEAKTEIVEELGKAKTEIMGKIEVKLTKDELAEDSMGVPSSSHVSWRPPVVRTRRTRRTRTTTEECAWDWTRTGECKPA